MSSSVRSSATSRPSDAVWSAPEPIPLVCLPYAGGAAAVFHRWSALAPPGVVVRPVELPGHGRAHRQAPVDSMPELVRWLVGHVGAAITGPYALFGHSFGAMVAFELARALRRTHGEPRALLVSGLSGPRRPLRHRVDPDLPDDALIAAAGAWGGLPPALLDFPALRDRQLRVLRADLRLIQRHRPAPAPPLRCPVVALAGDRDPLVDDAGLAAWRAETTGPFDLRRPPGGHLCVHEPAFREALTPFLHRLADGRAGG